MGKATSRTDDLSRWVVGVYPWEAWEVEGVWRPGCVGHVFRGAR